MLGNPKRRTIMAHQNDPNVIRARRNMARASYSTASGHPPQGLVAAAFVPVKKKDFLGYASTR
jgi:hypothetical protein